MSFIRDFCIFHEGNECPSDYVVWSGYAVLSYVMGPRVRFKCDYFNIYTDLLLCLVGSSGSRKSFARNSAAALIRSVVPDAILCADCESLQGIVKFMAQDEQTRWCIGPDGHRVSYQPYGLMCSELANFMQLDPARMATFLTDIVDCFERGYTYRIKNDMDTLPHPFFTMLACAVPEWLTKQIKTEDFCAGFGRRIIFICAEHTIYREPKLSEESKAALVRCVEKLRSAIDLHGDFSITPEAHEWLWKEWYPHRTKPNDAFLEAWHETELIFAIKVAMLTAISEGKELILTLPHFKTAVGLLDLLKKSLPILTGQMGRSELIQAQKYILELVKNMGGMVLETTLHTITFKYFKHPYEQAGMMKYMLTSGQLETHYEGGKQYYRLCENNL